jgi:hypothetical protein
MLEGIYSMYGQASLPVVKREDKIRETRENNNSYFNFRTTSAAGRSIPKISSHMHSENVESINMEKTLTKCLPATTGSQKVDLKHT